MLKVALSGGIASGKSSVSNAFAALGVPVIDADVVAREVVVPGSRGLAQITAHFGDNILHADGQLNRRALRERIFSNEHERQWLNACLHPLIRQQMAEQAEKTDAAYVLFVIPLLVETAQQNDYDRILIVESPLALRIQRLMTRDQISKADATAIVRVQASDEQRLQIATDRINNNGDLHQLQQAVAQLHHQFLVLARQQRE